MRLKSTSQSAHRSVFAAVIANPWSIALGLCVLPTVAMAQATILPASPAAPQAIPQAMPQKSGLITLDFRDVSVVQLITMIAQQGNVGILISPDVDSKLVIPFISLRDETPEDAIKKAAMVAGLKWEKMDDKTYMVGKTLPDLGHQPSKTPNDQTLPALPFSSSPSTTPSTRSLPDILEKATQGGDIYTAIPKLADMGGETNTVNKKKPTYAYIKIQNVPSNMMAWWIDPTHHPKPAAYVEAERNLARAINPYPVEPAVDPNITQQIQGNVGGSYAYNPNPYASPYQSASRGYSQFGQPYVQGNAQFGGNRGNNRNGNNRNGNNRNGSGNNSGSEGVLEAPKGIGTIISVDAQNALLVYGTADGVSQLRQIIDYLDRPIRQVEIEAQFVSISTTDASAFGLSFSSNNSSGTGTDSNQISSNFGTLPSSSGGTSLTAKFGSYKATLQALVSNNKARIVNSPRVTTLNNLTATLFSSTSTPIVLSSSTSGIGGQVGSQQNAFFLTTSIGLIVTPTINNDDTITVYLTPQVQVQSPIQTTSSGGGGSGDSGSGSGSSGGGSSSIPSFTSQYLTTVATVKDGDTIVLGGLRTKNVSYTENSVPILSKIPIIGGLFKSKQRTDNDAELVIFLTAHILHRTEDLAPLPGT